MDNACLKTIENQFKLGGIVRLTVGNLPHKKFYSYFKLVEGSIYRYVAGDVWYKCWVRMTYSFNNIFDWRYYYEYKIIIPNGVK